MSSLANRMGFYSAVAITLLVVFIDVGMIASNLLYPITTITSIEAYTAQFSPIQMLPFVPSLVLAPVFVILMLCGVTFLAGNALGFFAVNILASFVWGVLFPIATILLAIRFRKLGR